jgi:hypothetical protein
VLDFLLHVLVDDGSEAENFSQRDDSCCEDVTALDAHQLPLEFLF